MAIRAQVPALDALLGTTLKVLDDGFVRVIDYMGDDSAVVQAARVSYGDGTKRISEDRGLVRYLMRHSHTTPFEMCELKLHVRAPMDAWRQWVRHRTANVNEYSTRYSIAIDSAQQTAPSEWRRQARSNKQGSDDFLSLEVGERLSADEGSFHKKARSLYESRLEEGVAREQARKDLPLATYTEAYWKIDLHNLLHFLELRMDEHAQHEIRTYATLIGEKIVAKWVPTVWEAFVDYRLNAVRFTKLELEVLRVLMTAGAKEAMQVAQRVALVRLDETGTVASTRELNEFERKLTRLDVPIPWQAK
jgi:thymidylate synthase (FAD)